MDGLTGSVWSVDSLVSVKKQIDNNCSY